MNESCRIMKVSKRDKAETVQNIPERARELRGREGSSSLLKI